MFSRDSKFNSHTNAYRQFKYARNSSSNTILLSVFVCVYMQVCFVFYLGKNRRTHRDKTVFGLKKIT